MCQTEGICSFPSSAGKVSRDTIQTTLQTPTTPLPHREKVWRPSGEVDACTAWKHRSVLVVSGQNDLSYREMP